MNLRAASFVLCMAVALIGSRSARATGNDVQAWPLVRVQHGIGEDWGVAFTVRGRWDDNLDHRKDWLFRPYVEWTPIAHIPLVESLTVMAGYDYLKVNDGRNEHRGWQAVHHTPKVGALGIVHRVRLDERKFNGIDEVIWRLRYRLTTTRQLFDTPWYGRLSDEVFANLNQAGGGEGPASGFEGNRARVAIGRFFTKRVRLEAGYQFEYAHRRNRHNQFRHTMFLEMQLATGRVRKFERRKEAPVEAPAEGAVGPAAPDAGSR